MSERIETMTAEADVPEDTTVASTGPSFAVLGGGPAGVGAAWKLRRETGFDVSLYEAAERLGGNAASFDVAGVRVDYGSHRLHPVTAPEIMADIQNLLGDDLLLRPRHGRIRLKGSWIHFPLKPFDLATRLPIPFASSLFFDAATAKLRAPKVETETFESVLLSGLGRSMCENFYFPYVRKLWGREPKDLATTLAQRRVSGSSLPKLIKKILGQLPGLRSATAGKFFYPVRGFGQITEAFSDAAVQSGVDVNLQTRVTGLELDGTRVTSVSVETERGVETIRPDYVWSTLPISTLVRAAGDAVSDDVIEAAKQINYRGMILIYLVLETQQFSEYDAHYFPEAHIPMSRMSEPKNYSATAEPSGRTVLCAELPADPGDEYWDLSNEALGEHMRDWIVRAGLPLDAKTIAVETRRIPYAYPVYDRDYATHFEKLDAWAGSLDNLLTFGRQGLFAHDNTHHALAMAYGAVNALNEDGTLDRAHWAELREEFETHVVED